jgi:hypothetical protein
MWLIDDIWAIDLDAVARGILSIVRLDPPTSFEALKTAADSGAVLAQRHGSSALGNPEKLSMPSLGFSVANEV